MMMIKINPSISINPYDWWQKRFDTQLNEPSKQNSAIVPKVVKVKIKKMLS